MDRIQSCLNLPFLMKILSVAIFVFFFFYDHAAQDSELSINWLLGATDDNENYVRIVRERANSKTRTSRNRLQVSASQILQGIVSLGSPSPYWHLLLRAASIQRGNKGHITVLNIGGSSSTGAELDRLDEIFSSIFGKALGIILGVNVVVLNAAVGATGSDYYAICISQHISPVVDIVLVETAINDGTLADNNNAASVIQQLILGVQALAPHAVLVYSGFFSGQSCKTGEDIPNIIDVYKLYNATIVSTRNLVFGLPAFWNDSSLCPKLQNPFTQEILFEGKSHPGSKLHEYLASLLLHVFAEQFRVSRAQVNAMLPERRPLLDAFPFSGRPFECKSTMSPRFGAPLIPVPSPGCEVAWNTANEPKLVGGNCNGLLPYQLWEQSVSLTPLSSEVEDFPLVENWELSTASFFEVDRADKVRQDRKFSWEAQGAGASIIFLVRVGLGGMVALGYLEGDLYHGEATFHISNGDGLHFSVDVNDYVKNQRHTRALVLFRNLTSGWWKLHVEPRGRFGICAIATS